MKKLLFTLSILAMFTLVGCNPCKVGDCTCIMWTFENDTNETVVVSDLKDGTFSTVTIPPYAFVDVYVESAAEVLKFDYKPKESVNVKKEKNYTYVFYK